MAAREAVRGAGPPERQGQSNALLLLSASVASAPHCPLPTPGPEFTCVQHGARARRQLWAGGLQRGVLLQQVLYGSTCVWGRCSDVVGVGHTFDVMDAQQGASWFGSRQVLRESQLLVFRLSAQKLFSFTPDTLSSPPSRQPPALACATRLVRIMAVRPRLERKRDTRAASAPRTWGERLAARRQGRGRCGLSPSLASAGRGGGRGG